jgi:hypothetical protein
MVHMSFAGNLWKATFVPDEGFSNGFLEYLVKVLKIFQEVLLGNAVDGTLS